MESLKNQQEELQSRPTRGAWIEILAPVFAVFPAWSRPTRGAWIEIRIVDGDSTPRFGRAPHGARGLKSQQKGSDPMLTKVAPHTGRVD